MAMKAVLVTGGAGYIGSHVAHELADGGARVVVLDDLSTGRRGAVPGSATIVAGDVGDGPLVRRILAEHDIDAILHFAGSVVVPESVARPLDYYRNNTSNSRELIAAAVEAGVKAFIFSSTAAVYGDPDVSPVAEDSALRPVSPYGSSKLMTEVMLRDAAAAHGLSYMALRYFNVAGADPQGRTGQSTPAATHLIKVAVQAALGRRERLDVFGTDYPTPDGTCVRDYIHVSDLARAHVAALDHLLGGGESLVLNCGYGHGASVREVVETVKRVSNVDFPVREAPRRPGDPASLVAGVERIFRALDWRPRFDDLETIVAHALAWEKRLQPA